MTNKLTLIKRSTPICPQCNIMQLVLEEEGVEFDVIDIAIDTDAIEKYDLSSVPVILIQDGENTLKLNGIQPIQLIKELLED